MNKTKSAILLLVLTLMLGMYVSNAHALTYQIDILIEDCNGDIVEGCLVTLNNTYADRTNASGYAVFTVMDVGVYNMTISCACCPSYGNETHGEDYFEITDADIEVEVTLPCCGPAMQFLWLLVAAVLSCVGIGGAFKVKGDINKTLLTMVITILATILLICFLWITFTCILGVSPHNGVYAPA